MKLLGSYGSPFVRKVRIFALEKNLELPLECHDVWNPKSNITNLNPLGKIPCLQIQNGLNLIDSRTIVEYLEAINPIIELIPGDPTKKSIVKTTEAIADGLLDAAILARREIIFRQPQERSADWIARQMDKVEKSLTYISNELGDQVWLHYDQYCLADIALGCALGWLKFRLPQFEWEKNHPNLESHYSRLSMRDSFKATIPKD